MKKLENYQQIHNFQDKVTEELSTLGVTIAYSSFPQEHLDFTTLKVGHTFHMEHKTSGYEALALRDLEARHVREITSAICKALPASKGEVTIQTYSSNTSEDCWLLESTIQVRPFKSNVKLA